MNGKLVALILGGLLLTATGCEKKSASRFAPRALMSLQTLASEPPTQRFIAERHELEIITPESGLQRSWESVVAFCGTIQCEIISSKITTRMGDSVPSGTISLRVVPQDLTKLLTQVQKAGNVAQHTTEREDKTTAVVDTDAKLKNLTSFRDNLRAMLAKPSATVKDLIEIQQQLTETQSELDCETAQRKILANETEKIAVQISFRVEESSGYGGGFAELRDALRESGSVLAESTASLITVIVAVIPWLILIVPTLWLFVRAWRKRRRNRTVSQPPPPAAH
jgi:cytochrome c-type biogenesis protein CcmH/NrfF